MPTRRWILGSVLVLCGALAAAAARPELPMGDCGIPQPKTDLRHCRFVGVELKNVDFSGSDLRGVKFDNSRLENVNFSGALLAGANFVGAKLRRIRGLDKAVLELYGRAFKVRDLNETTGEVSLMPVSGPVGVHRKLVGLEQPYLAQPLDNGRELLALLAYPRYASDLPALIVTRFDSQDTQRPRCQKYFLPPGAAAEYHWGKWQSLEARPRAGGEALLIVTASGQDAGDSWQVLHLLQVGPQCELRALHREYASLHYDADNPDVCQGKRFDFRLADERTAEITSRAITCTPGAGRKERISRQRVPLYPEY
jgi:hypothetical protein